MAVHSKTEAAGRVLDKRLLRQADQAAQWAASQAISAAGTLQGYTSVVGAGTQYAAYWTPQEMLQADSHRRATQGGP
jgi:hypothetical protein